MPVVLCPVCGTTAAHIEVSGRVGCPRCYMMFQKEILAHLNRSASVLEGVEEPEGVGHYTDLVIKLQKAVALEDYEEAALLRDRISALKETSL